MDQIEASDADAESKDLLIAKYGLLDHEAERLIARFGGAEAAAAGLVDEEGNLIDETGEVTDEFISLADALATATANQDSLANAMLEFANPMIAAAAAVRDLDTAETDLKKLQDDHHTTLEELADQELKVLEARLKTQAQLDAFSAGNIQDQVDIIRDVMGKSEQEALDFLFALDLIDAADINADVGITFTARGSPAAAAAAAMATGSGRQGSFGQFVGGLQHGGRLGRGQAAIVGEAGPEVFVPGRSGMILPNDALTGGVINNNNQSRTLQVVFNNPQLANDPVAGVRAAFARDRLQKVA
jgi:hypothetical protein